MRKFTTNLKLLELFLSLIFSIKNKEQFINKIKILCLNILFIINILLINQEYVLSINSPCIFTFWEPHNSIPGYISLCIDTWKKYFPSNYKIIILDYSNIRNYLGYNLFKQISCKDMSLPIQADAIRVAILHKFGGIWLDSDSIIINSNFTTLFNKSDLQMFGNSKTKCHLGVIYANNKSIILKTWLNEIINNIKIYKHKLFLKRIFPTKTFKESYAKSRIWCYLGNGILNRLLINETSEKDFKAIDLKYSNTLPDQLYPNGTPKEKYLNFYFSKNYMNSFLENCKGIIMLHNSWTPSKYKKMSKEEFLHQDIMLSHLLRRILNITI